VTEQTDVPFVDVYSRSVAASPEQTWAALQKYVERLTGSPHGFLLRVLGTVPRSGFEVVGSDPPREVVLGGRHRFSTYRLVLRLEPEHDGSRLHALTYAAFPGLRGWAYRSALMLTTGHRRAAQRMLGMVARRAESSGVPAHAEGPEV
jgi:hypothetical protein